MSLTETAGRDTTHHSDLHVHVIGHSFTFQGNLFVQFSCTRYRPGIREIEPMGPAAWSGEGDRFPAVGLVGCKLFFGETSGLAPALEVCNIVSARIRR